MNSVLFSTFMTIITVYILFASDIKELTVSKDQDVVFYGLNSICLGCFTIEIIINIIVLNEYFLSFPFYLDLISTFSILLDIGWIT